MRFRLGRFCHVHELVLRPFDALGRDPAFLALFDLPFDGLPRFEMFFFAAFAFFLPSRAHDSGGS
jgi:hypothetical protein